MVVEYRRPLDERTRDDAARVALIERSILVLLVVGLLIGVPAVVKPFTMAILFGAALATAAWPIRQALVRRGLAADRRPRSCCCCRRCSLFYRCPSLHPTLAIKWCGEPSVCSHISRPRRSGQPDRRLPPVGRRLAAAILEPYNADVEQFMIGAA